MSQLEAHIEGVKRLVRSAADNARSVKTAIIARRYSSLAWMSELMSWTRGACGVRAASTMLFGSRLSGQRLLDAREPRRVRARAGEADARRLNRPAAHLQRRRHADDREVRCALMKLAYAAAFTGVNWTPTMISSVARSTVKRP